jgi:hypothetical protein
MIGFYVFIFLKFVMYIIVHLCPCCFSKLSHLALKNKLYIKCIYVQYLVSFFNKRDKQITFDFFLPKINMLEERNFRCYPHVMLHQVGKFDDTCILDLISDIFPISSITLNRR